MIFLRKAFGVIVWQTDK